MYYTKKHTVSAAKILKSDLSKAFFDQASIDYLYIPKTAKFKFGLYPSDLSINKGSIFLFGRYKSKLQFLYVNITYRDV